MVRLWWTLWNAQHFTKYFREIFNEICFLSDLQNHLKLAWLQFFSVYSCLKEICFRIENKKENRKKEKKEEKKRFNTNNSASRLAFDGSVLSKEFHRSFAYYSYQFNISFSLHMPSQIFTSLHSNAIMIETNWNLKGNHKITFSMLVFSIISDAIKAKSLGSWSVCQLFKRKLFHLLLIRIKFYGVRLI